MRFKLLTVALLVAAFAAVSPARADIITTGVCTVGTDPRLCAGLFQEDNQEFLTNYVVLEGYTADGDYLIFAGRSERRTDPRATETGACANHSTVTDGVIFNCAFLHEESGSLTYAVVRSDDADVCYVVYADATFTEC